MIVADRKFRPISLSLFGPLKFMAFLVLIMMYILDHSIVSLMVRDSKKRNQYFLKGIARYATIIQYLLNIKVVHERGSAVKGSLIVANHMSYVDVLVLAVAYPSLFITSKEIQETPVLGHLAKLGGCFFVERRRSLIYPGTKEKELSQMREMIVEGFNVLLFPEGTSSDGSSVLPFKATFFQLACDTKIPVVPVTLKYLGEARHIVPWYGSMTFVDHLLKICTLKEIVVELKQLPAMGGANKFELAKNSHALISESYG